MLSKFFLSKTKSQSAAIEVPPLVIVSLTILLVLTSMIYVSRSQFPTITKNNKTTPLDTPIPITETIFVEPAKKSGCVYTFRFEKNGLIDDGQKNETFQVMKEIERQLKSGSKSTEDILFEIVYGIDRAQLTKRQEEFRTNGNAYREKYQNWINPYADYTDGVATNICFTESQLRDESLGLLFYQSNNEFKKVFDSLKSGEISEPFLTYRLMTDKNIEYAWMLIALN